MTYFLGEGRQIRGGAARLSALLPMAFALVGHLVLAAPSSEEFASEIVAPSEESGQSEVGAPAGESGPTEEVDPSEESRPSEGRPESSHTGEVNLSDQVELIRLQLRNGWLDEAASRVDAVLETTAGRGYADMWLLKADISYQRLHILAAIRALEHAQAVATPEETSRVAKIQRALLSRVGAVEIRILGPTTVVLKPTVQILDPHLEELVVRVKRALRCVGRLSPEPACLEEAVNVLDWREEAAPTSSRMVGGRAFFYLPLGWYTLNGRALEVVAEEKLELVIREAKKESQRHWEAELSYLNIRPLSGASLTTLPSMFLGLSMEGTFVNLRIGVGGVWQENTPEIVSEGLDGRLAKRPSVRMEASYVWSPRPRIQVSPSMVFWGLWWPYTAYACESYPNDVGPEPVVLSGQCRVDTWALAVVGGGRVGYRAGAHGKWQGGFSIHAGVLALGRPLVSAWTEPWGDVVIKEEPVLQKMVSIGVYIGRGF